MALEKGNLTIHSENIFPIIKKWLYSDHDIFLREVVSNGCDAITKIKKLNGMGELDLPEDEKFKIDITYDEKAGTITISDNGVGLDEEEVKKYINQIAFSGAEDFLNKYKDKADKDQIIGHFGLGFYSTFMVSDFVEIQSLSYKEGAKPVHWKCDGGTEYEIGEGTRTTRGTDIILHLGEEGEEFKNEMKIRQTLMKYCSFMPYEIYFKNVDEVNEKEEVGEDGEKSEPTPLNTVEPLYTKKPNECSDEDYLNFYRETFVDFKEPLFHIHLNMDFPFNLKGILYFPKINMEFESIEGQIKLYNSQVFVADNIKEVIPEYLLLLKGVMDCPDLPLNVSRSFLQNDGFVKKISNYITRKVADKLKEIYKEDKEKYTSLWDSINPFIKYGSIRDEKFYDRVKNAIIYKTTKGDYVTLDEFLERNKEKTGNKVFYVTDTKMQANYVKMFEDAGLEAVILDDRIDQAFISTIEAKMMSTSSESSDNVSFARIDADIESVLSEKVDEEVVKANEEEATKLVNLFKDMLSIDVKVKLESLKDKNTSAIIVLAEQSRRMQEMSKMYGFMGAGLDMPSEETLLLNKENKLVDFIIANKDDESKKEDVKLFLAHIYDLALMSHKSLEADRMTQFISRSNEILEKLI